MILAAEIEDASFEIFGNFHKSFRGPPLIGRLSPSRRPLGSTTKLPLGAHQRSNRVGLVLRQASAHQPHQQFRSLALAIAMWRMQGIRVGIGRWRLPRRELQRFELEMIAAGSATCSSPRPWRVDHRCEHVAVHSRRGRSRRRAPALRDQLVPTSSRFASRAMRL